MVFGPFGHLTNEKQRSGMTRVQIIDSVRMVQEISLWAEQRHAQVSAAFFGERSCAHARPPPYYLLLFAAHEAALHAELLALRAVPQALEMTF